MNISYCGGGNELPEIREQNMLAKRASLHMDQYYGMHMYSASHGKCTTLIIDLMPAETFAHQAGMSINDTPPQSKYFPGYVIISMQTAYGGSIQTRSIIR